MSRERLMRVLLAPRISEKSEIVADKGNQFIFEVIRDATKSEIKHAVELMFEVRVKAVNVLNMKGKRKRFGRIDGRRKGWKKAYVTLETGYDLDFQRN